MNKIKRNIYDLDHDDLAYWFLDHGMRSFRAKQVMRWLYTRRANDFGEMTDIAKPVRRLLAESFDCKLPEILDMKTASDGTRKLLLGLSDGQAVESVLIPERDHHTLCVSTQVGCAMGCAFCMTAKSGLARNLTTAEILGQVIWAKNNTPLTLPLKNLVFMGMGEPLANYTNLVRAIRILSDSDAGMQFASRRITVSTSGIVPKILELARDTKVRLAVSLNAVDDRTRSQLMPVNTTYPIADLLRACKEFAKTRKDRITVEYVLIKGINDSKADAKELARLVSCFPAKINLIPYNPHEGSDFARPENKRVEEFRNILLQKNFTVIVRWSKGADIKAACGQLRGMLCTGTG